MGGRSGASGEAPCPLTRRSTARTVAAREHDDGLPRSHGPERTDEVEAAAVGKHQIEHHEVGLIALGLGFREIPGDAHREPVAAERIRHRLGDRWLVLHDEDMRAHETRCTMSP
jgi:hypothetical protein